ncbi:hypothetical protein BU14_0032s0061 [Porphyra umbilicalis]|uniref:Uncharacterized protein n=1 Tax=Porphyra umbilicalis TaxID=2786 RepID=A0A1X6PJF3_PORUM|nr:hypothetical protein BU14_0032s0061 [Porphyra umbilicalis]|eukprot:OSX80803.1 hypothetical protein BU14_0032s0061 [Porphyra umbilicalis]
MATQLFSDATLVSKNGAHYVYPIRVRFPNIVTGKVEWVIVGFIPIIKPDSDDGAEKERVRMLRDEVLQRCLAVLLDSFIAASETGVLWDLPGVGPVWVVPRVVLYAADQPEERHLLGLKLAGCKFQCSHCLVHKDEAGCPHDAKPARDVVDTIESQLSSAALFKGGCSPAVLEQISEDSSIVPIVPLLAAVHGLGTGSFALYDIFGFDLLHVMKLGVIRVMALKIPSLLKVLCKGGLSRFGPWRKAVVAMAERARHVGRLPNASISAPGYLVCNGVNQATFTGHSWRHGLVVLMFMVVGMVSRRLPGSTEPLYSRPKKRGRAPQPNRRQTRRRTSASEREATEDSGDDSHSDAGTDGTMTGGEEAMESAPVPDLEAYSAEYLAVFGGKATHDAVLEVVCRAASIMGQLCGDNKEEGFSMSEADCSALAKEAYEFVTKYVRVLFGAINTTKFHALAYHLLSELLLRGNVIEADTSINESLHKLIKVMWQNSNKQDASFVLQMLRCEQTLAHVIASDNYDKEQAGAGDGLPPGNLGAGLGVGGAGGRHPAGVAAGAGVAAAARRRRHRRVRISGRRVTVAQAVAADGGRLQQLPAVLGVASTSQLIVANTFKLEAVLPWRVRPVSQLLRAAPDLYRKPWYDHVWYTVPGSGSPCDTVVLQCLEAAEARPGCVLSEFNCRRFKWQIHPTTRMPVLLAVPLADVRRLEHVVPDFEDLCERWGLMGTPTTIPDTPREREEQRFFTNPFFPWTSHSVADAP